MKRILFLIAIMFCAGLISAQDVIVLRTGELIENISIINIGNEDIAYSKEGDTLTLPRNSAEAVLYADGRYEENTYAEYRNYQQQRYRYLLEFLI